MNDGPTYLDTAEIVVDEVFPHSPETIWKALTSGDLMARWLKMAPVGFVPVVGNRFTYQTTPAGQWDGLIRCEVLEIVPFQLFAYSWKGGHEGNVGYGSLLDTVVTFTLQQVVRGTRLRLLHSGFSLPKNDTAYRNMSQGWTGVVSRIGEIVNHPRRSDASH